VAYTRLNLARDAEDIGAGFGGAPGLEFRNATLPLGLEQGALSLVRLPPGERFPFGHAHRRQEETYVVVRGAGRMKVDDDVLDLGLWDAVRVAPGAWRGYEAGPDGLDLLVFGAPNLGDDPRGDVDGRRGWWSGA
jgi:quercetin dioxygenase-like cupin family protein